MVSDSIKKNNKKNNKNEKTELIIKRKRAIKELKKIYNFIKKKKAPVIELIKEEKNDPYRILIGTILSARTRDEITAKACKRLFLKAPDFNSLRKLKVKEIEELIKGVGFYKNKAIYLKKISFINKVPENLKELKKLPGVGLKTANLVLSVAFNKEAICVDTHVFRISQRLNWIKAKNPEEAVKKLELLFPKKYWSLINRSLVPFGQLICKGQKPDCNNCLLKKECFYYNKVIKKRKNE